MKVWLMYRKKVVNQSYPWGSLGSGLNKDFKSAVITVQRVKSVRIICNQIENFNEKIEIIKKNQ